MSSLRPTFAFVVLALFCTSCTVCAQAPSGPLSARQLHAPPPDPVDQEQFLPYWTTETGWDTELQLRNNLAAQSLVVTPFLRTADGRETALPAVTLKPREVQSIDLNAAIGSSSSQLVATYGSVVLRYHSVGLRNLYAALMLRTVGHPIAFHVDATGEIQNYESASREGIWWLPNDAANDYLILNNEGMNALQLDVSVFDAVGKEFKQKLALGPRQTSRLSVRELVHLGGLTGSFGGIKISSDAHAGSLDSLHFLFDTQAGFSALLKMFDHDPNTVIAERDNAKTGLWTLRAPMLVLAQPDPALAFPDGTALQPQLFIRNTTSKPLTAALGFHWRGDAGTGKAQGPTLQLRPYETRRIDVAALQDGKVLPKDAHWTSVTLTTNSRPDEVMAVAASYDAVLQHGAQTPFSDQLAFAWEGGMWEYDAQHNSIMTAGNGGTKPTRVALTLFYNHGTERYDLEQTLQPDEQMWIDIGKLIREHVPDKNGKTLPADLSSGSYEFSDLNDKLAGTLFEGKIVYEKTYGHATYGCMICCDDSFPWLTFNPLGIPFSSTSPNGVWSSDCNGIDNDVSSSFAGNWTTANTNIATVDFDGTHTGVAVGPTTSYTYGPLMTQHGRICYNTQQHASGGDNVKPKIMFNGQDITGTTQSVVVGQQIVLYDSYALPSGVSANFYSWNVPGSTSNPPTAVGNFVIGANSSTGSTTSVPVTQQQPTFYFVAPGNSQTVTFTLGYGNNQSASASATFNVAGPTSVGVSTPLGQWQINPNSSGFELDFGFPLPPGQGIQFNGQATSPSGYAGTYEWAQLIGSDNITATAGSQTLSCTAGTGLDNVFPYDTGLSTADSPSLGLPSADSKVTRSDSFTMYFMWRPGLTGDIPVPLGYVSWQIYGDAVQSGGTWTVQADSTRSANSFQQSASYPAWTSKVTNGSPLTCH